MLFKENKERNDLNKKFVCDNQVQQFGARTKLYWATLSSRRATTIHGPHQRDYSEECMQLTQPTEINDLGLCSCLHKMLGSVKGRVHIYNLSLLHGPMLYDLYAFDARWKFGPVLSQLLFCGGIVSMVSRSWLHVLFIHGGFMGKERTKIVWDPRGWQESLLLMAWQASEGSYIYVYTSDASDTGDRSTAW